jgi:RNA polymerase sigma factor (sigma-70 family)
MSNSQQYVDTLILEALRNDDERALDYLFTTYYNTLYRVGIKWSLDSQLTEECIQDVLRDIWQYRHTLSDIQSFEAYLKSSLKKRIARHVKQNQQLSFFDLSIIENTEPLPINTYEDILIHQEEDALRKKQLQLALNELSPRQKEIIILKYFEERSYKEIAEHTNLQVDTIYKILHEGLKRLRHIIGTG